MSSDIVGVFVIRRDGKENISFRDLQIAEEIREKQSVKCNTILLLLSIPFSSSSRADWIYKMQYKCFMLPSIISSFRYLFLLLIKSSSQLILL